MVMIFCIKNLSGPQYLKTLIK